jgi:MinD-like ATPase involved in chromosome partitioning or flagellar assembly
MEKIFDFMSYMQKVVCFVSYTGKVGKSTFTNNLFLPRMKDPMIFRLETINDSGLTKADELKLKGRDLEKLQKELSKVNSAVVDVGASNVESFMLALSQQDSAHFDFDLFVVPVIARAAAQAEMGEAIKTIQVLHGLGIPPEKIYVIFNRLEADADVEDEAKVIFNFHKKSPIFTLNKKAVVHETPAFKALSVVKKSYGEMLADDTDYRQKLRETPLEKEKERELIVALTRAQGTVKVLDRELNAVFSELFGVQNA